jgi:hypothetical protein
MMSDAVELSEREWKMVEDTGGVRRVAEEALRQIGWDIKITTRLAIRANSFAPAPANCVDLWCVKLAGIEPEIRHCRALWEKDGAMVQKFAESFAVLRS